MVHRVVPEIMALLQDFGDQIRMGLGGRSNDEEGCLEIISIQEIEQTWCCLGMWSIVKTESNGSS